MSKENIDLNRYNFVVSLLNEVQQEQLRSYLIMTGAIKFDPSSSKWIEKSNAGDRTRQWE